MKEFKSWLLTKQQELAALSNEEPDPQVWEHAGLVIDEAGNRAARLGLTDLYERARSYGWSVTTREAVGFLTKCLTGLPSSPAPSLDVHEVAKLLGCTPRTIWRHEGRGLIPAARRVGRVVRWDRQEVEDFLTTRE